MTTDLDETRLQVLFLPVNVYVEDSMTVSEGMNSLEFSDHFIFHSEINLINIYRLEVFNYRI